ncbi:MAG: thiamine-phosphate kinase [Thermoguttaceae bacterium]
MELEWIAQLRRDKRGTHLGDDAAILGNQLYSVDTLTEGVDFLLHEVSPQRIGRKALAVNLSDIAAMGGIPTAVLVSVVLPLHDSKWAPLDLAQELYLGMEPLLDKYSLILAGGDTNCWDGGLVISITAIGKVGTNGAIRRSGGCPNDVILVTGPLGGSILRHQFDFEPRIRESDYLNTHYDIHAAIDLSDGLSLDLHRLAAESKLGAILKSASIPISDDARVTAAKSGRSPLEHALSDGEDFELLLCLPRSEAELLIKKQPLEELFGVTLFEIGTLTEDKRIQIEDEFGVFAPLSPNGFIHGSHFR